MGKRDGECQRHSIFVAWSEASHFTSKQSPEEVRKQAMHVSRGRRVMGAEEHQAERP